MNLAIIISMAGISVGSAITESILDKFGKSKEAQYCNIACTSSLAVTAIAAVVEAITAIRKLA